MKNIQAYIRRIYIVKKILIIIGKLYIGGAERVGRDIGFFADKSKYEIHYVVFEDIIGAYEKELEDVGCIIHHVDPPSSNYKKYYHCLVKIIKEEKIDIIHSHTMFSSGWAMLAGKKCGVPIRIAHSHTIRGPEKRGILKNTYEKIMRHIVVHNATDLIACGKGAGEWFYGAKTFSRKGKIIYNGIDLSEFEYNLAAREKIRNQYSLFDKFVIGHVGHLAPVKNQTFLLELMPKILNKKPNAVLLLLGEGEDRQKLNNIIIKNNLQDYVIMTGNVPNVGEYMNAMDVFVFPSLYEGMPLALVEAQTNGLPCCISDRIPEDAFLTDLIRVIPFDNNDTEWIRMICDANRKDSSSYGQQIYQMGFDVSGMLERIYQIYKREVIYE